MLKLAVFGNPIKQSKSPIIHKMFAEQVGIDIEYTAKLAPVQGFSDCAIEFFKDPEVKGCNVTAPFKLDAFNFADQLSEVATTAGAVNTLKRLDNGKILGDNTDGGGLVNDILNQGVNLTDMNILLIGAGGASRGVLMSILKQNPASLSIVNRTVETAQQLVGIGNSISTQAQLTALSFAQLDSLKFDIVINATSLSLTDELPDIPKSCVKNAALVYDMVYRRQPTAFLKWAKENGAKTTIDGLGMLIGQAALSFQIWTGHLPDTKKVEQAIRDLN